jgi:hypothetical protein
MRNTKFWYIVITSTFISKFYDIIIERKRRKMEGLKKMEKERA